MTGFSVIQNVFPVRGTTVTTRFLFYLLQQRIAPEGYKGHWPKLMEQIVPVPPKSEQDEICTVLDTVGNRFDLEKQKAARLAALKSALLDALLSGRVRVSLPAQEAV